MNDLMDDFARILATPMPRRKAFKLFGGALAAAVFAISGPRHASAAPAPKCAKGQVSCGPNKVCCTKGWFVCGDQCVQQKISSQPCTSKC